MGGGTTLYDELEVSPNASTEVIQGAYRSLVKRYHPDRNPGDESAAERMLRINEAYAVLGDPEKRAAHDAGLAEAAREAARRIADEEAARRAYEMDREMRQRYSHANLSAGLRGQQQAPVAPPPRPSRRIGPAIAVMFALLLIGGACWAGMAWLDSKELTRPQATPVRTSAPAVVSASAAPQAPASAPPTLAPSPVAPPLSSADEVTIVAACNSFQLAGDVAGLKQCKEAQLGIAAGAPPVSFEGVPAQTVNAVNQACRHYQMAGDLAGHRKCLSERLAEPR